MEKRLKFAGSANKLVPKQVQHLDHRTNSIPQETRYPVEATRRRASSLRTQCLIRQQDVREMIRGWAFQIALPHDLTMFIWIRYDRT